LELQGIALQRQKVQNWYWYFIAIIQEASIGIGILLLE
jgi:hypothetical protein